eukprot:2109247-Pleurochrysis_carterae.AAC.2
MARTKGSSSDLSPRNGRVSAAAMHAFTSGRDSSHVAASHATLSCGWADSDAAPTAAAAPSEASSKAAASEGSFLSADLSSSLANPRRRHTESLHPSSPAFVPAMSLSQSAAWLKCSSLPASVVVLKSASATAFGFEAFGSSAVARVSAVPPAERCCIIKARVSSGCSTSICFTSSEKRVSIEARFR